MEGELGSAGTGGQPYAMGLRIDVDEDALSVGEFQAQRIAAHCLADIDATSIGGFLDASEQPCIRFVAWAFRHIIPPASIPNIKKDRDMRIAGIMLLLTLILQGCGRKGPLLLPPAPTATPPAAATQPAPDKSETKK